MTGRTSSAAHAAATHALRELGRSDRGAHFWYDGVLIVRWLDVPLEADVRRLADVTRQLVNDGLGPFAVLQRLPPESAMPSTPVRNQLIRVWLGVGGDLAGMVLVLGGEGFWASAARATVNGMMLAAARRAPIRVCRDLNEGLPWLLTRLGRQRSQVPELPALREAVEQTAASTQGAATGCVV